MSGVFGCWHLDGRPLDRETFRTSLERLSPAPLIPASWHSGPVGVGHKPNWHSPPSNQPQIAGKNIACVFDGRLDNRDELLRTLGDKSLDGDSHDSDFVRAAYEVYGEHFADRISGDFACAVFDAVSNRLILARDRLGVRPLCFTAIDNTFLFASEAKPLLAWPGVRAAPDDLMMADFVLQFVSVDSQNRTFFRDIQSLPPAHVLLVTPRGFTLRRYFDFDTRARVRHRSVDDYVDAFHQLVTTSVRNRLRHRHAVAVSVSGGLDSAYIFSIAARLAHDDEALCPAVLGFNYSAVKGTASDEEVFVRGLERACGVTIERIAQRPGFMRFAADEVRHSESPLGEALACQRQAMFRRVHEAGAGRLLTGHWGDQMLFDTDYLVDLGRSGHWSLLEHHARAWGVNRRRLALRVARDLTSRYLPASFVRTARRARRHDEGAWRAGWYTKRFRKLVRERFEATRLARLPGTSHAWAIYQQCRRGYHVQCLEWNSRVAAMHGLDMAFPYLDCDLAQFLMSIPGEIQSYDGVPRGLMRKAMRGIVPDAIVDRRSKGEFTQLANRSIELDFHAIAEILGPTSLAVQFGYVDGPALWPLLTEWKSAIATASNATLANRLLELCGIELLLREFTHPRESMAIDEAQLSVAEC
jgi:asparagine synthase (glutamine-hydrolysing)